MIGRKQGVALKLSIYKFQNTVLIRQTIRGSCIDTFGKTDCTPLQAFDAGTEIKVFAFNLPSHVLANPSLRQHK